MTNPTRRTVLVSLAALPLAPACTPAPDDDDSAFLGDDDDSALANDDDSAVGDDDDSAVGDDDDSTDPPADPYVVEGDLDATSFPSALQVTDAAPDSVLVGLRTIEPDLRLHLGRIEGQQVFDAWTSDVLAAPDGIFNAEITALLPDTGYQLYAVDPSGTRRSDIVIFRTALAAGTSRAMSIAVTSCLGRTGAPWNSLRQTASESPDVCLLLGDTVYADGATSLDEYRGFWDEALGTDGIYYMSLAASFVATWDDHEVDNNWSWDNEGDRVDEAIAAFRESFPQRSGPDPDRVYRTLPWGDAVELIVLDCRADRLNGDYISAEQMAWIKDTLSTSTARFKLILNSVPIIDFTDWIGGISADDRWQGNPTQREELLGYIEDEGIQGVLFLGGDMHFGSVCRVSRDGEVGDSLYEVMAGPGGSVVNPMTLIVPTWTDQFELVVSDLNTVLLNLDPATGEVGVTFIDDNGDVIDEKLLSL